MASKKQQAQKKKLRMLKKKKKAENKILEARSADPEKKVSDRGSARPDFNSKGAAGRKGPPPSSPMHRPQGG